MTNEDLPLELIEALLDGLEALEDPLLAWGVMDARLSAEEVEDVVAVTLERERFPNEVDDVLDAVDRLEELGLVLEVDGGYRTRIGEHLRLLSDLRQLFPGKDGQPKDWRSAPRLVDGIRYIRRPRRYPRRDSPSVPLVESLTRAGTPARAVLSALTSDDHGPWDLAGFQARATERILAQLDDRRGGGTIVGAGTGAGKTLAFYLPAFTYVANELDDERAWTKVVALYPRNELLKDQLQGAVEQARDLAGPLKKHRLRPIRIGALFGSVPQSDRALKGEYGWRRISDDKWLCPFLRCPEPLGVGRCHGQLVVDEGRGRGLQVELRCMECRSPLSREVFAVTRDQLRAAPPDVLFSSTEMLSRALLDPATRHVVGVDTARPPGLVLLDEVHTYGGTTGAMTALTLRRWRSCLGRRPPVFVGLSATLLDAQRFFGDLVGERADRIDYVEPSPEEMVPEGAEYLAVVRGDPTSQTSLLSTSIQTAMLLGRTLDKVSPNRPRGISDGLFGSKTFLFTDDLDVTNRLYHDLLDAEGQRHRRRGNEAYKPSLAHLRSAQHGEPIPRRTAGQVWELAEITKHDLGVNDRMTVGRTTSQDQGVDPLAQIVVATASLEVGVDDDAVGAVMQHKAPNNPAAFLQRKGRAGRKRGTRPMTTVVVSDYGRDREAYEAWDRLVDPLLEPSGLPVGNTHVLRMQAAMETLVWAGDSDERRKLENVWSSLLGPKKWDDARYTQQIVRGRLTALLDDELLQGELARHLMQALDVERDVVEDLLWRAPRPILLGFVPAVVRRISDAWAVAGSDTPEDAGASQPAPEFIPRTLFSKLALPEVLVDLPPKPWEEEPQTEAMGVIQAIRQVAPGRITKRFAVESDLDRVWIDPGDGDEALDISTFVKLRQNDGVVPVAAAKVPLVRPLRLATTQPDAALNDSSHGRPRWATEIVVREEGHPIRTSDGSVLADVVGPFETFLHRDQAHAEVRRGAYAFDVDLKWRDNRERSFSVSLVDAGEPVAIGASFDVDAIRLKPRLPSLDEVWRGPRGASLRTSLMRYRVATDPVILRTFDGFVAERLADLLLLTVAAEARANNLDLETTMSTIVGDLGERLAQRVGLLLADPAVEADLAGGKLGGSLRAAVSEPQVVAQLQGALRTLRDAPDEDASEWLRQRMLRTVGECVLEAARLLCPEHDPRGLLVDVEPAGEIGAVWVSEEDVGGGGFIEALVDAVEASPRRFMRLVRSSLRPGSEELAATALERTVRAAADATTGVNPAFAAFRTSTGARDATDALSGVRSALVEFGVPASPAIVSSVANRLLRAGSDAELDRLISTSLSEWQDLETQLEIEVPVRLWSLLDAMQGGVLNPRRHQRLQSVLWPRGATVRGRRLTSYNPFSESPSPAPEVLMDVAGDESWETMAASDGWPAISRALATRGSIAVTGALSSPGAVLDALAESAVTPVDLDFLRLHASATEVRVDTTGVLEAQLGLPELGRFDGATLSDEQVTPQLRTRRINTTGTGSGPVASVLHTFFVSELIQPSSPLWLVSAWLSDVVVVDNRSGELLSIAPGLPVRELRLVEVLTEVVSRGGQVHVVVRDAPHNNAVVGRLNEIASRSGVGDLSVQVRRDLHHKTLVSDRLLIEGSMNLTFNGAEVNEEGVRVFSEPAEVSRQRMEFNSTFGSRP